MAASCKHEAGTGRGRPPLFLAAARSTEDEGAAVTRIYRNDLIYSVSYALDFVEREVVMVSTHHSRRVAYLAASLGKSLGYSSEYLLNLAACAALHDNALSEYQQRQALGGQPVTPENFLQNLSLHCTMGEQNIAQLSFYPTVRGAILCHHENADGSGPFGRTAEETPVFSRLIHIADTLDARFDFSEMSPEKFSRIGAFVRANTGSLYDPRTAGAFLNCFSTPESLSLDSLDQRLRKELPEVQAEYQPQELIALASIFSKIIDYKSPFTCRHSSGIAEKARQMGACYGWDADTQAQLYLAGSLHDIGKLMVRSSVLEKPGLLTEEEYRHIQNHAYGSYLVLRSIRGMEEISRWAYLHHEKLDGSGYPFGLTGKDLNQKERLMACLDIYQALREDRPYKAGFDHEKAMKILTEMGSRGQLDAQIIRDLDACFGAPHAARRLEEEELAPASRCRVFPQ